MAEGPKTALVTGACGFIGSKLVNRLSEEGYKVRALSRTVKRDSIPGVESFEGDIRDEALVREASKDSQLIFHLAGVAHRNVVSEKSSSEFETVNVDGTRILERVTRDSRVALVYAGTVAVYGPGDEGVVFDEQSPLQPGDVYAETKARAEEAILKGKGTVLRFPAVYGSGMKGNLPRLAKAVKRGLVVLPGSGENRKTLVHVEDAVRAMILCAESPESIGRIYNVTDGTLHTVREIVEAMGDIFGKSPALFPLPVFLARTAARAADLVAGFAGDGRGYRVSLEKFVRDSAVSGALIEKELGFKARIGIEEGLREAIGAP